MADSRGKKRPKGRRKKTSRSRPLLRWLTLVTLAGFIACTGLLLYYTALFNRLIDSRLRYKPPPQTAVLAADGTFLANLWSNDRLRQRHVAFADLPPHLVHAVLAAEDQRFFEHSGVDPLSLARAAIVNLIRRQPAQGGSTLTQQFVKNTFLSPEKTLQRKLQEAYFAWLLERRVDKEEIFELYANSVYLGQYASFAVAGFGEAANLFFDKTVGELKLAEAALLAGLIQAPNRYAPDRHPETALKRRNHILRLMEDKGFLTPAESIHASRMPLGLEPVVNDRLEGAAYFVDFVRAELREIDANWRGASRFTVQTTLDTALQAAAEEAVSLGLKEIIRRHPSAAEAEVALVAVRPESGELVALVGGADYSRSQFNRALRAQRQPGSTFKPFVLASSLRQIGANERLTLATQLDDAPNTFRYDGKQYSPKNAGDHYYGRVSVRETLSLSLNVATVHLAERVGFDEVARFSQEAGFPESHLPYPSIALGSFEVTPLVLARAYTALASGGMLQQVTAVRSWQNDGVSSSPPVRRGRQVISPEIAFLVTSVLKSAIDEGTAREIRARGFMLPAAGKTGTTDDSWFAGYTPDLLCVVWVGFDDSRPLGLSGAQAALPIWTNFMKRARRSGRLTGADFEIPPGIVSVEIDPETGLRHGPGCGPGRLEYFLAGTEPLQDCRQRPVALASAKTQQNAGRARKLWGWIKKIF